MRVLPDSVLLLVGCMALAPRDAAAQPLSLGRAAIELVAAAATTSEGPDDPFLVLDVATTFRLTDGVDVIVRPYARRLPGGDWDALFYQAEIRYQPAENVRVDAGIITSPFGLATLQLRPDLNPTVAYPFYYFTRLPAFDEYANQVQVLSGGYPLGAVVSMSGARWDARAGITDSTPARYRKIFARNAPGPMAQLVAGGGITPWPGFRIGGAIANGRYRTSSETKYYGLPEDGATLSDASVLVMNIEAEWSYGHTRLAGEWVRDRFDTAGRPAISRAFYVQGVQTLTPRVFAAARVTRASTPVRLGSGYARWSRSAMEVTAGYRLTPELTLRAGYEGERRFGVSGWNHAAVASVVWARRWF